MEGLSLVLVCKIGILPTTYFGFPFGNSLQINESGMWWRRNFREGLLYGRDNAFLKGGRLALIKSMLSTPPIYFLITNSSHLFYVSLWHFEEGKLRAGTNSNGVPLGMGRVEKKPHLTSWSIVQLDKRNGGLGIISLYTLTRLSLANGARGFALERESFWKHVIARKFNANEKGWHSRVVIGRYWMGLQKAIRNEY